MNSSPGAQPDLQSAVSFINFRGTRSWAGLRLSPTPSVSRQAGNGASPPLGPTPSGCRHGSRARAMPLACGSYCRRRRSRPRECRAAPGVRSHWNETRPRLGAGCATNAPPVRGTQARVSLNPTARVQNTSRAAAIQPTTEPAPASEDGITPRPLASTFVYTFPYAMGRRPRHHSSHQKHGHSALTADASARHVEFADPASAGASACAPFLILSSKESPVQHSARRASRPLSHTNAIASRI